MSAGIDLDNVVCDFGKFRAVDHVNVNIQPGEFFSFLGPSGCGKTTILRMISGFIEPTGGAIRIGGKDMRGQRPNQRPTALIFQNLALFPLMPVWENISFGLEVRGVDKVKRRAKAEELLALVDLHDSADKMVSQLSGGQKQRVAIARALAVEPSVMLLDEPLSALDLKLRQNMRAELRAIQKRTGVTFVFITHDQGEALAMSDRVGVMSQGKLQQVANPRDIYNNPVNGFVASFVGENNILTGSVVNPADGYAALDTSLGRFRARIAPSVTGSGVKLYVRPEHMRFSETPAAENSVPVTISDVAFEGNFISVQAKSDSGMPFVAELRNDGTTPVPAVGTRLHVSFDAARAAILPDAATGAVPKAGRKSMTDLLKRYGMGLTATFLLLTAFWILVLLILPNLTMFESSFRPYLPVSEVGGPKDFYSLNNYAQIFGNQVDMTVLGVTFPIAVRVKVFILTIWFSAVVTVITFILAYPLAYYLAKIVAPKSLPTLFLLLFVPLWVSEILRSFAWFIILAFKGPLNVVLMSLGIIDSEIRWIAGFSPVIIGLVYTYVLFMVFPLYNALQSLDSNQIEAAEDLGSPWWRTHLRVILPHAKPGIASGAVMVFMLSAGSLLVPSLLGSTSSGWFTQTIQGVMLEGQDWNTGAAFAFMLLIVCTIFVSVMMRVFGVKLSDIAK